ncbi:TOBE domain-containing protein [Nocardioides sp.]|uniref:TOBE domain-containing protein n=1 Tax=Nocardioides sp. TaxID=35761 RepID=UPI0039E55CC2
MADYVRIGEVATALGVSVDTLRRWEAEGRIEFERRGNQRVLSSDQFKRLVATSNGSERSSSARNRFAGVVVSVIRDGVMAQVEMQCGDYRVVSLMSREAADDLGLEPGVAATAVVKSTNVVVETEPPRPIRRRS